MAYQVISGTTGPKGEQLGLAVDGSGNVVLADTEFATAAQFWELIYDPTSDNFAMLNVDSVGSGTPAVLAASTNQSLSLAPLASGLGAATTWNVAPGGSALAVRPGFSTSFNLNVAGTGPYGPGSTVIAYDGWGGGQPNEIWTFNALDGGGVYPWDYAFAPECASGLYLSADVDDPTASLTIQKPSGRGGIPGAAQLWASTYVIKGTKPLGAVFVNEAFNMAIHTKPGGGPLFPVDQESPDVWTAWIVGPGPDARTYGIGSVGDQNLFWNVSGAGPYEPGNPVITYPWQGGAVNELWYLLLVPQTVTLERGALPRYRREHAERREER